MGVGAKRSAGPQLEAEDHSIPTPPPPQGLLHSYITGCSLCNLRLLPPDVEVPEAEQGWAKASHIGNRLSP